MKSLIPKIEEVTSQTEFSGVISIFQNGNTVYNRAFGYRDIKNNLLNNLSTKFGIASGTNYLPH